MCSRGSTASGTRSSETACGQGWGTRASRAGGARRRTWPQRALLRLHSPRRSFLALSQIYFFGYFLESFPE
jgi:hypothetical protein